MCFSLWMGNGMTELLSANVPAPVFKLVAVLVPTCSLLSQRLCTYGLGTECVMWKICVWFIPNKALF
jgi:hypothetical protein